MKLKDNKNILCTVSAGYSSIMMAVMLPVWYPDHKIVYVMANSSREREESLQFMHECDKHFNLNMNWVEAVINQTKGKGTNYRIVNFYELKRNGEIFEQGIMKYGIPSKVNKWCNRELKLNPIRKFANKTFGRNNYSIAVGMRADELDRVGKDYFTNNTFYPLMDNKITTKERNKFWSEQPIQITIPAYKGNCDLCFEKSYRKLATILKQEPYRINWWKRMTKKYSQKPIEGKDSYNFFATNGGMNFWRQNITIEELQEMAKSDKLKLATDEYIYEDEFLDKEDECGAGCKVF